MAEARLTTEWDQTSLLAMLTVNMHRDPKKGRAARLSDFHPFMEHSPSGIPITKETVHLLKVFVKPEPDPNAPPVRLVPGRIKKRGS